MKIFLFATLLLAGAFTVFAYETPPSPSIQPPAESAPVDWPIVEAPAGLFAHSLTAASARPTDAQPKLDSALAGLVEQYELGNRSASQLGAQAGIRTDGDRVQVQAIFSPGDEASALRAIAGAGGEVTGSYETTLQAWIPAAALSTLAGSPAIAYIQVPDFILLADPVMATATSEGVAAANAAAWHAAGHRGQGLRIGIIDGGFQGYTTKLGTDLPTTVVVKNFVDGESGADVDATTRHGTACAEIVHDMAPGAQLYLIKIATDVDLSEAVTYAINQGVDIISTSLTFINATPGDGTGKFAGMTQAALNAGVLWVTAAGNYRETHWGGSFADPNNNSFHNFGPTQEVNFFGPGNGQAFLIPSGYVIQASIRWDDWTAVNQDYSLYIVRYNASTAAYEIVGTSQNPQSGQAGQRPTERVTLISSGDAAIYGVAIQRVSGNRNVFFNLLTPNRELDKRIEVLSLGSLADVPAALTVAAVNVFTPFGQEDYSSEGPTNGPGGAPNGGQRKPDLAAFANVTTASYGNRGFNGTSAATPHVAGAAALVLTAYPHLTVDEIRSFLASRAIDQGVPGPDVEFGYGRLNLGPPPLPIAYDHFSFTPVIVLGNRP